MNSRATGIEKVIVKHHGVEREMFNLVIAGEVVFSTFHYDVAKAVEKDLTTKWGNRVCTKDTTSPQ
jgi:hypothetical protein